MNPAIRHFVQIADALREPNAWTNNEWLCRPDIVAAEKLLLVRANMDPMHCHPFHYHPHREEIIYVVYGRAEQWVGNEHRILRAGEMAHIPAGTIHATYQPAPRAARVPRDPLPRETPRRPGRRARPVRRLTPGTLGVDPTGDAGVCNPRMNGNQ